MTGNSRQKWERRDHDIDSQRFTVSENGVTLVTASMLGPIASRQAVAINQAPID